VETLERVKAGPVVAPPSRWCCAAAPRRGRARPTSAAAPKAIAASKPASATAAMRQPLVPSSGDPTLGEATGVPVGFVVP